MTQLFKETQKNGDTNKSKRTNKHTKHKPRLNMYKNTLGPTGLYELVLVAVHNYGKLTTCSVNARDHFNCSPLLFSRTTTKQMRPNGKGGNENSITDVCSVYCG